jgi:hypothetical protein
MANKAQPKYEKRKRGRPSQGGNMKRVSVYLDDRMWVLLRNAGHGNASLGIRLILEQHIGKMEVDLVRRTTKKNEKRCPETLAKMKENKEVLEDPFDL